MFRVIKKLPPFWPLIKWYFPNANPKSVCIAFNKTLYTYGEITPDLWEHEKTHLTIQGSFLGACVWWVRYCLSRKFRLEQEVLAYRKQWQFIEKNIKDKNWLFKARMHLVSELSSPLYGNLCSKEDANRLIVIHR